MILFVNFGIKKVYIVIAATTGNMSTKGFHLEPSDLILYDIHGCTCFVPLFCATAATLDDTFDILATRSGGQYLLCAGLPWCDNITCDV
jgi:hypothetical protein